MYTIYHNPRCKKSRAGLEYLKSKNVDINIIEYLKNPLSADDIAKLIAMIGIEADHMVRKQEAIYKSDYKGKSFTNDKWAKIIAEHPKLLNRPIIVKGEKAVWGDPIENIDQILK